MLHTVNPACRLFHGPLLGYYSTSVLGLPVCKGHHHLVPRVFVIHRLYFTNMLHACSLAHSLSPQPPAKSVASTYAFPTIVESQPGAVCTVCHAVCVCVCVCVCV